MRRIDSALPFAIALVAPLALGGCPAVLVVGGMAAAGGAGYEAASERGAVGSYDDFAIKSGVENAWNNAGIHTLAVTVYAGDALLTGYAPDEGTKRRAFELASTVPGIRHVYNEIETTTAENGWDTAEDAWITAQLRKDLILEKGIRSDNYTIQTVNRSVYLMGSARSQQELDTATYLARYVPGVRRVVSYVQIRSGEPAGLGQASPPPSGGYNPPGGGYDSGGYDSAPGGYSPPPSAPAGNSSPIQVQKL